jgi:serine/threonine protein kinase
MVGTLSYMAPEELAGKKADARSDIFALGAVVYEMAAGRKVFDGNTPALVAAAILHTDPPAAGVAAGYAGGCRPDSQSMSG